MHKTVMPKNLLESVRIGLERLNMLTASSSHQASVSVPEEGRQLTWRQSEAPDPAHERPAEPAQDNKP